MKLGELVKNPKGFRLTGIYRITRFEVKTAKNGKTYGDCLVSDPSFDLPAKYWDIPGDLITIFQQNSLLVLEGTLDYFKDAPQLIIERISVPSRQEVDKALKSLGMMSGRDIAQMYQRLSAIIAGVSNNDLRRLLDTIFIADTVLAEKFSRHPGAVRNHHACIGGLLEHTLEIVEAALDYCARNKRINRDLLVAAALIHDIGKVREIEIDILGLPVGFTKEGKLLRHIYLGMEMVECACRDVGVADELCLVLKHCIYSHHGQADWGSPVEPMLLEAEILHYLDNLSAKTEEFIREEDRILPGGFNRSLTLRREIYRPNIEADEQ
ncbi:MAG: 3'-5' exoribonuclease YhaM family protein [Sporomusa sp.]